MNNSRLHKEKESTENRKVFTTMHLEVKRNVNHHMLVSHDQCLFFFEDRCKCHDHSNKKIMRPTPTDVQKTTNHTGIGLGYNPGRQEGVMPVSEQSGKLIRRQISCHVIEET